MPKQLPLRTAWGAKEIIAIQMDVGTMSDAKFI
jgi:hypothetical protein